MALAYCKHRNLDIFKKPVHIVPMWDTKKGAYVETIWPSISELRTTAARTKQYAGIDEAEFGPPITMQFKGSSGRGQSRKEHDVTLIFPEWCRMTVYRVVPGAGVCKFVGPKVKWIESYATIGASDVPNNMWQERPEGQLEKCAEAAALRRAFPEEIGNEMTAEEMEGRQISTVSAEHASRIVSPDGRDDAPPKRAQVEQQKDAPADDTKTDTEKTDEKTGEVTDVDFTEVSGDAPSDDMGEDDPEPEPDVTNIPFGEPFNKTQLWAAEYVRRLDTLIDTSQVYKLADNNVKGLDVIKKRDPDADGSIKAAILKTMDRLNKPKNKPAENSAKKTATSAAKNTAKEPADDKPPKRTKATTKKAPADDAPAIDPENQLKWICQQLDTVKHIDDLENFWTEKCEPVFEKLEFPPDKDAALAHYDKTEKKLGGE
jgi:phage recombination protein Bet